MITADHSKKVRELQQQRHQEYMAIFKEELKKAKHAAQAAKVAGARFRQKYGQNPDQRWADIVNSVVGTGAKAPKATKSAAPKSAAPKATAPKKAAAPKMVAKTAAPKKAAVEKPKAKPLFRKGEYRKYQGADGKTVFLMITGPAVWNGKFYRYDACQFRKPGTEANYAEETLQKYQYCTLKEILKVKRAEAEAENRANMKARNEARKAKEAADKKAHKEMLKVSPQNVAKICSITGLNEAAVKMLYRISAVEELWPVMCGLYFDERGYVVSTDAHTLAAVKVKSVGALKGKIIAPSGKMIEGRYPNWLAVLEKKDKMVSINDDPSKILAECKTRVPKESKEAIKNGVDFSKPYTKHCSYMYARGAVYIFDMGNKERVGCDTERIADVLGLIQKAEGSLSGVKMATSKGKSTEYDYDKGVHVNKEVMKYGSRPVTFDSKLVQGLVMPVLLGD